MEVNEVMVFYGIIAFSVLEFIWESYLDYRQYKVYVNNMKPPEQLDGVISQKTFEKARSYAIDKSIFNFIYNTFSFSMVVGYLFCNGMVLFWDLGGRMVTYFGLENTEILQSSGFVIILNAFSTVIGIPGTVYYTFVLEEKHGFNKQTVSFFIWDRIKKHILLQVVIVPLTAGIIFIVRVGGDYLFLYLWLFVMTATLILYTIYPDYIAPRFDKYTLLPEGDLKTEIEKLAQRVGFPLYKIYVVEGSKRSAHSNAYFYGLFNNKRIVLFDTLLKDYVPENSKKEEKKDNKEEVEEKPDEEKKGCDTKEVLAVLGHELGHWKLNHIIKNLVITQANLLLMFVVFGSLFRYKAFYKAFGFYNIQPVVIGMIVILHFVSLPYFELLNFCMAILSRRFEFEADCFAKTLGYGANLKSALIKLNIDNLGFPIFDRLYSKWHHSHPPLLERLQALDKEE